MDKIRAIFAIFAFLILCVFNYKISEGSALMSTEGLIVEVLIVSFSFGYFHYFVRWYSSPSLLSVNPKLKILLSSENSKYKRDFLSGGVYLGYFLFFIGITEYATLHQEEPRLDNFVWFSIFLVVARVVSKSRRSLFVLAIKLNEIYSYEEKDNKDNL